MPPTHARFTEGSVPRHVLAMACASALSLLSVFLVDILTLVYVSRLHDPSLLAAVGLGKTLQTVHGAFVSGVVIAAGAVLAEPIGTHASQRQSKSAHPINFAPSVRQPSSKNTADMPSLKCKLRTTIAQRVTTATTAAQRMYTMLGMWA